MTVEVRCDRCRSKNNVKSCYLQVYVGCEAGKRKFKVIKIGHLCQKCRDIILNLQF